MWENKITGEDVRTTYIWNSKDPPLASDFCMMMCVNFGERYIRLHENIRVKWDWFI